jgi:hypothetical protein
MVWRKPCEENNYLQQHAAILVRSFTHWTGKHLVDPVLSPVEQAHRLFFAPFVVLSHEAALEPVFTYGNQTALILFELSWEELTRLPSRESAEPLHQTERERLLATVARQGYIDDYRGVRISKTGRRFMIERAIIWNLLDDENNYCGQAAMFKEWSFVDI